jgi:hypothetical protein
LIALCPGVASEDSQFSLIRGETENRVERGGLTRAIRANEPENTAFFDTQIDAIQRDRGAESLAEAASFYACHSFSVSP